MAEDNLWGKARELFTAKRYEEAISVLDEIINQTNSLDALYDKILCLFYLHQNKKVMELIHTAPPIFLKKYGSKLNKLITPHRQPEKHEAPAQQKPSYSKTIMTEDGEVKQFQILKPNLNFKNAIISNHIKNFLINTIINAIMYPDIYKKHNKKIGEAVIFYGPPGTGKTYLAKIIAGETKANLIILNSNEILSKYLGSSNKNIHALFEQARKNTPSIIFMDEIESLTTKRSETDGMGSTSARNIITQLLTEMDGIEKNPQGVFIIGATNRPWEIDSAFKRSGRFNNLVYVGPPNLFERIQLFKFYLSNHKTEKINYLKLALRTANYSQSDISHLIDISTLQPINDEINKHIDRPLTTKDILYTIHTMMPKGSLENYWLDTKKELLGKYEVEYVDKKKYTKWKSGSLDSEGKKLYKDLIRDIKRNSKNKWKIKLMYMLSKLI
ncbi:MAG: ATP-binding protein [Caldisericum sp.]|uniref:ATP-binding protein n=1 Tax=Caldisericum sp. TaxID=2499687 RepID=UPI003D0B4AB2